MIHNERGQLVKRLRYGGLVAARDTLLIDVRLDYGQRGLRIAALGAQHKLLDELVEQILQLVRVVRAVHHEQVVGDGHLRAQLAPKVLGGIGGRAAERPGYGRHVRDDRLDAVAAALDLGRQLGHLVAVVRVLGVLQNVQIDVTHSCSETWKLRVC